MASRPSCSTGIPISHQHSYNQMLHLGKRLYGFQNEDTFCDVTIKFPNKVFKAHKVILAAGSDFFKGMFSSNFQEQTSDEVNLEYGDIEIFEPLLEFLYTGNFTVNPEDSLDVLEMANFLQVPYAFSACADYLAENLTEQSCKDPNHVMDLEELDRIISLASNGAYKHRKLSTAAHEYIKANLNHILQGGIGPNIPVDVLYEILCQGEELALLYSEEELLSMLMEWLTHDWINRRRHATHLLKKIRLGVVPHSRLKSISEGTITEIPECRDIFNTVFDLRSRQSAPPGVVLSYSHPELFAPRSTVMALIGIGGYEDQSESFVQYFDSGEDRWIPLHQFARLPYAELTDHSTIVVDGKLFVAGGKTWDLTPAQKSASAGKNFHCYCENTNTWIELPSMHTAREQFSLVHLDRYIYAIGGQQEDVDLLFNPWVNIERFNLDTMQWEVMPHQPWGSFKPCAVVYKDKILVYGPDEYDDSPGERSTYYLMAYYPDIDTWKTVWKDHRVSGYRQSILTVVDDVCYEIRFVFEQRNIPVVREVILDLESDPPTMELGGCEDQSSIECNEVCIKEQLYTIITFPGYVNKKPTNEGSWFHSSSVDGAAASVICFTFDKLRLM
ncbi:kelch-like protein 38 [Amphiura filiformis]|uniref:kelch-like protein 38 n=1 Tax=Amphiura filiformis TaxID=82378 RepID=UPI003B21DE32